MAVELFVAVLGASNYTFAEATRTQTLPDFAASVVRSLEHFDATPNCCRARWMMGARAA